MFRHVIIFFPVWKRRNNKRRKGSRKALKKMWWSKNRGLLENKVLNLQPIFSFSSYRSQEDGWYFTVKQLKLKINVGKGNQIFPSLKIFSDIIRWTQLFLMFTRKSEWQLWVLSPSLFSSHHFCFWKQSNSFLWLWAFSIRWLADSPFHHLSCTGLVLLPTAIPMLLSLRRRLLPTSFLKFFSSIFSEWCPYHFSYVRKSNGLQTTCNTCWRVNDLGRAITEGFSPS